LSYTPVKGSVKIGNSDGGVKFCFGKFAAWVLLIMHRIHLTTVQHNTDAATKSSSSSKAKTGNFEDEEDDEKEKVRARCEPCAGK